MNLVEIVQDIMINTGIKSNKQTIQIDKNVINIDVCPFCHNGKSKKSRSYILLDGVKATFYCHNGGCPSGGSLSIGNFSKQMGYFKGNFNYINLIKNGNITNVNEHTETKNIILNYNNIDISETLTLVTNLDYDVKLNVGLLNNNNLNYLQNKRKITKFICNDIETKILRNRKNDNIIIPYYNKTLDNVYYLQERTDKGNYYFLKVKDYDNEQFLFKKIYNLYNVDEKKPIIMFEGVFDTFFVENSISIGGSKNVTLYEKLKIFYGVDQMYYIQDNDKAGTESAHKVLKQGGYVFQWYLFLRNNNININIKDINDLYINNIFRNKLTYNDLKEYFTNKLEFNFI